MFLSKVFSQVFVNVTQTPVELFSGDGSVGAALGAGIGAAFYKTPTEAFNHFTPVQKIEPVQQKLSDELYHQWKKTLMLHLK